MRLLNIIELVWLLTIVLSKQSVSYTFEHPVQNIPHQPIGQRNTVKSQLERYPFLRETIKPQIMAARLNGVSRIFKSGLILSSNLIIDGEHYHYCYSQGNGWCFHGIKIGERIRQYKRKTGIGLPDCYFLMITRDEIDDRVIPSALQSEFITPDSAEAKEKTQLYQKFLIDTPALMMSINLDQDYQRTKILIPDGYMLTTSWQKYIEEIEKSSERYPWGKKVEKAFWRGADTGCDRNAKNPIEHFPRLEMVLSGKRHPQLVDAMFTRAHYQCWNPQQKMKELGLNISQNIKPGDHLRYKYLPSADGWTAPWQRVPWILLSNSVLLKQETNKIEWFFYKLQPLIHYYPLKENVSDLVEAVEWLKANDEKARQISEAGTKFAYQSFKWEDILEELWTVFKDIAEVQNYTIPASIRMIVKNSPQRCSLEELLTLSDEQLTEKLEEAFAFQLYSQRLAMETTVLVVVVGSAMLLILVILGMLYFRKRYSQDKGKKEGNLRSVSENKPNPTDSRFEVELKQYERASSVQ